MPRPARRFRHPVLDVTRLEGRLTPAGVHFMGPQAPGAYAAYAGTAREAWTELGAAPPAPAGAEQVIHPDRFLPLALDADRLGAALPTAVHTLRPDDAADRRVVTLPKPGGTLERFDVWAVDVLSEEVRRQFPGLRTFRGVGLDDPAATLVADLTAQGFHAQVQTAGGWWYIDPLFHGGGDGLYQSYALADYTKNPHGAGCTCALCAAAAEDVVGPIDPTDPVLAAQGGIGGGPGFTLNSPAELSWAGTLRTYRAAVTTDTSYFAYHQGTSSDPIATRRARVLSAITTSFNRISGFYEQELSARFTLVGDYDQLLFDGTVLADPFVSASSGSARLNANQTQIDTIVGTNNYELGHNFSGQNLGGLAQLRSVAANGSEARGYTGLTNPVGDFYNINYVSHEVGHQFGANHNYNSASFLSSVNFPTSVNPGLGSTVMDYTNQGGVDNYQSQSDPMFSWAALNEITANIVRDANGGFAKTALANAAPRVTGGGDFVIPARTMFALSAQAADADGDALTYSWEQADPATTTRDLNTFDIGTGPLFRTFVPTTSPTRSFPSAASVAAATINFNGSVPVDGTPASGTGYGYSKAERLPTTNRNLNFKIVVRDNRAGGAAVAYDGVNLKVVDTGAAFAVTNVTASWAAGSTQTVTWAVAGTTANGINTDQVRILLSTDGGLTFPHVLADRTPNDGTQAVTLPYVSSAANLARVKVEAANSVFFAVSNKMTVTAATAPGGVVSGVSYTDRNGNGVRGGEPAAPGRLVYADADGNGRFDNGLPLVTLAGSYPLALPDRAIARVPFTLSGMGGTVADVRVRLSLTHANPGELAVALVSPSGRRVELFAGLGFSGANITNLLLSSTADTGLSQASAPYTGTFKPEGNTTEFAGEPVDGTWVLEVADRVAGNAGTLTAWTLGVVSEFASPPAAAVTLTGTDNQRVAVPVTVPALGGTVTDLDVRVNLNNTEGQGLRLWLLNPAITTGTLNPTPTGAVSLFNQNPNFSTNLRNVVFDDQAATAVADGGNTQLSGPYLPTAAMTALYDQPGDPIAGTWRLLVNNIFGATTPRFTVNFLDWGVRLSRDFAATAAVPLVVPDNGTLTATLPVQLVGGPLQYVGLTLSLTHPDLSQVKAYLTSPVGTKVQLVGGLSGANLTGTTFDDEAATKLAGGSAPYTGTFKPAEPLSRFDGEDGSGTWTLTVQDTAVGQTGSVTGWGVSLIAPTRVSSVGVPMPVGVTASRSSTLFVANADGPLSDLDLTVALTHPATGELTAYLISPAGTKVTLTAANTSGADWTSLTFDDEATTSLAGGAAPYTGRFRPASPLSAFDGQWANGFWTLQLDDSATAANSGTLTGWSLSYSAGERFTVTAADGSYALAVPGGTFAVRDELPGDVTRSQPAAGSYAVSVTAAGQTFAGRDLGGYVSVTAGPTLTVNAGEAQRSRVTGLSLTGFGGITGASAGAFTLSRTGGAPQAVTASGFAAGPSDTTTFTLSLPAAFVDAYGSLLDGAYTLSVNWALVAASGPPLGGTTSHVFHRLYGDGNGDATVNLDDLTAFTSAFGTSAGEAGYVAAFDYNADTTVNLDDLTEFTSRFGVSV